MNRRLKTMGAVLVAALAIGAAGASAASADLFESESKLTHLTGVAEDNMFTITSPEVNVECSTSSFEGMQVGKAALAVTVNAHYTGLTPPETTHEGNCRTTLGEAEIDMNSCAYILTSETDAEHNGEENTHAQVHVVCEEEGDEIQITDTSGCTIDVPEQTPTEGGVAHENVANGDVKVNVTTTGITYTSTGFVCELGGLSGEANNADYEGSVAVEGFSDAEHTEPTNIQVSSTE